MLGFPKEKHQNSQKWAKFMNFSFCPFLGFGLPGRLLKVAMAQVLSLLIGRCHILRLYSGLFEVPRGKFRGLESWFPLLIRLPKGPRLTNKTIRNEFTTHSEWLRVVIRYRDDPFAKGNSSMGFTGIFPRNEGFTA